MAFPADNNLDADLVFESGRIQTTMSQQARARNKNWGLLTKKGSFPLGMNSTISHVRYERSIPASDFSWSTITINNGGANNANPTGVRVSPASTQETFSLAQGALDSDAFSIHDANLTLNFPRQLNAIITNLEGNVLDIWEDRYQDEYIRLAGHKIIADDSVPETGSDAAWSLVEPTSQITLEYLEYCYDRLMRDGGQVGLPTMYDEPTPYVFASPEVYRGLKRLSTQFRDDWRFGYMGSDNKSPLLNPLQTTGSYGHFQFKLNWRAPRYDFVDGDWVRRPYYATSQATIGTKADPSALYRNAEYEDTVIFHPNVYDMLMYDPDPSYQNGAQFDANNWYGRFKWVNNKDNDVNVDGNTGYFRALLASAAQPNLTNLGYVIRAKRCPADFGSIGCTYA
jgi:hypothetical protein